MRTRSATGFDEGSLRRLAGAMTHHEYARKFSQEERDRAEKQGNAMPGGRYPIENQDDLDNAVEDWIRTGRPSAVGAHIHAQAKKLGLKLPAYMADS